MNAPPVFSLYTLSAKPFHKGHADCVLRALAGVKSLHPGEQRIEFHVIYSSADRKRRGEFPISGAVSSTFFRKMITPWIIGLSSERVNVHVVESPSPYLAASDLCFAAQERGCKVGYLWGGDKDQRRLEEFSMRFLFLKASPLTDSVGVSGTLMRQYLDFEKREDFKMGLPDFLTPEEKNSVWNSFFKGVEL